MERYYAGAVIVQEEKSHARLFTAHCLADSQKEAEEWACKGMSQLYPKAKHIQACMSNFVPGLADDVNKIQTPPVEGINQAKSEHEDSTTWFEEKVRAAIVLERNACAEIAKGFGDKKQKEADAKDCYLQDYGFAEVYGNEIAGLILERSAGV